MPLHVPCAADTVPKHVGDAMPDVTSQQVTHCIIVENVLSVLPMPGRERLLTEKLINEQI